MPYDEGLAERIREVLEERSDVSEKKMFGGLTFLLGGNMCAGVVADELMVRVGPDAYEKLLSEPHTREMDFTGRPMKGFVYVGCEGFESDADLRAWIERGVAFAGPLPPKQPAGPATSRAANTRSQAIDKAGDPAGGKPPRPRLSGEYPFR